MERKPLEAKTISRLNGIDPIAKDTRINEMQNAQALGDIPTWRKTTQNLVQYYPDDSGVIKAAKSWMIVIEPQFHTQLLGAKVRPTIVIL